ncbi:MAG: hypothetical protein J3R72DRAFT_446556 [Linnemannia gamsii]|nr:MAG: hypothetical protein J3R72DRAFT_446556 [Linnemannia gamsii]
MTTREYINIILLEATLDALTGMGSPAEPSSAVVVVVPVDMRILPDSATRVHLTELYYKSHYLTLPMVQREVLRVCEENIHIPHCLFLCNAVYFGGSLFLNSATSSVESAGEEYFLRGQDLFEQGYLGSHICTIQGLLLFASGNGSFARRSRLANRAITMALTLSLHVKQDESTNSITRAYLQRVFWCCFVYDSTFSSIGGEPTLVGDEDITADMFEAGDLGTEGECCSDQYFLHNVRGWKICREIRNHYARVVQGSQSSEQFLVGRLEQLDASLVEWQQQMPDALDIHLIRGSLTSPLKAMAAGAQLFCYALIIFLHYPYLPDLDDAGSMRTPNSQGYCTQASLEITRITGIVLEEAPWIFKLDIAARYAVNLAVRIHHRNSYATYDPTFAREGRRDLRQSIGYVGELSSGYGASTWDDNGQEELPRNNPMTFGFLPSGLEDVVMSVSSMSTPGDGSYEY